MSKPAPDPTPNAPDRSSVEAFKQIYLRNVDGIVAYFARRSQDPQAVADLTAETFAQAATGYAAFDPLKRSDRAWLLGIADRAFRQFGAPSAAELSPRRPRSSRRRLDRDEIEELTRRIDAERKRAEMGSAPPSDRGPAPAPHARTPQ